MAAKQKQSSGGGWRIPLCKGNPGRNLIVPEQADEVIKAVNALGKMEIVYSADPEPSIKYSDGNVILVIPDPANVVSEAVASSAPWQISIVSGTTIQVSSGYAFITSLNRGSDVPNFYTSSNAATDITLPTDPAVYQVWLKCYISGSDQIAEINTGELSPANWTESPSPQYVAADSAGYVMVGNVTVSGGVATTITQYLYCNPSIFYVSDDYFQRYRDTWSSGSTYLIGDTVYYSGAVYTRYRTGSGDNGGTPGTGGSCDWV